MQKVPTRVACQISGVTQQRLNEAAHFGHMSCLPETRPGVARAFTADDIIALMTYAALTRQGLPGAPAGAIACAIRFALATHPGDVATAKFHLAPETADDESGVHSRGSVGLFDASGKALPGSATSAIHDATAVAISVPVAGMRRAIAAALAERED